MAIADILEVLVAHDVEFIIVGGMAAILQGAPVHTLDLDVVYSRTPENVERLLLALAELSAIFRDDPRRLKPNRSHLESAGHKLLETSQGPLDLLGTIEENTGFDDLIADCDWMNIGGMRVRVLSLSRLIEVKQKLGRAKDQAMLVILKATLDEKNKLR
jgi:predicted nucleotidyltransferase